MLRHKLVNRRGSLSAEMPVSTGEIATAPQITRACRRLQVARYLSFAL